MAPAAGQRPSVSRSGARTDKEGAQARADLDLAGDGSAERAGVEAPRRATCWRAVGAVRAQGAASAPPTIRLVVTPTPSGGWGAARAAPGASYPNLADSWSLLRRRVT